MILPSSFYLGLPAFRSKIRYRDEIGSSLEAKNPDDLIGRTRTSSIQNRHHTARRALARSMDRYFNNLEPGKVRCRVNWALATNDHLCERGEYRLYAGQEPGETEFELEECYVRCEL